MYVLSVFLKVVTLQDLSAVREVVKTPSHLFENTEDIHALTTFHQKSNLKILLPQTEQNNKMHFHLLRFFFSIAESCILLQSLESILSILKAAVAKH